MKKNEKRPDRIILVGGREFRLYSAFDDTEGEYTLQYPDFSETPAYTDEGRPFSTAAREGCPQQKPKIPGDEPPGDCGGCGWFHREQTPWDIIGICMCESLRRPDLTQETASPKRCDIARESKEAETP